MNPDLNRLQPYPFEKLNLLKADCRPPENLQHIPLSIGEPKHAPPQFVVDTLASSLDKLAVYPTTRGLDELRQAISSWASRRFGLNALCPDSEVLPVNGTREALFAFTQAVIDRTGKPLVVCPNPFYQIYEGAAFLAGAEPFFLNCLAENNFIPDFSAVDEKTWQRCQLLFLCSPGNPTGAVINTDHYQEILQLADK